MLRSSLVALALCPWSAGVVAPADPARPVGPPSAPLLFELDGGTARARRGGLAARVDGSGLALVLADGRGGTATLGLRVEGADGGGRVLPEGPVLARVSRYAGRDPSAWRAGLPAHAGVVVQGVRPGVDLVVRDGGGHLEYDLRLAPGARVENLALRAEGATALGLEPDGRLAVTTPAGELRQAIPACWQEGGPGASPAPLEARFVLLAPAPDGTPRFGFRVEGRDPRATLVVDPALAYASFLGGALWDRATSVATAPDGGAVVCGFTTSPGFPATAGAPQGGLSGYGDAFVSRFAPDGSLAWSTFLGGNDPGILVFDTGADVAVAADGSVALAGWVNAADFPATPGAWSTASAGDVDGFVARLDPSGALAWASYLGGSLRDEVNAVDFAPDGGVVVGGLTFSKGSGGVGTFPTTPGAFDTGFSSIFLTDDAFVSKFSADGSRLAWSTLLGGQLRDEVCRLAVDAQGRVLATGLTGSVDFPVTPGAWDTSYNGTSASETDAFVARLEADGSALSWASFLGGPGLVEARGIALDAAGAPVVAGLTRGATFPVTPGALQAASGGGDDAWLAKFAADGSALAWSTFLGGTLDDDAKSVAVGPSGEVLVVGTTRSADFPLTADAAQPGAGGGRDGFLAKLSADGAVLVSGTYLGGSADDEAFGVSADAWGAAWVVGGTSSAGFPLAGTPWDGSYGGGGDAFVVHAPLPPWFQAGFAKPGSGGQLPRLVGTGTLQPSAPGALVLSSAKPNTSWFLFVALSAGNVPFKGGTLVPFPPLTTLQLPTLPEGGLELGFSWPGLPPGVSVWFQGWIADSGAANGASATNGLRALQP